MTADTGRNDREKERKNCIAYSKAKKTTQQNTWMINENAAFLMKG